MRAAASQPPEARGLARDGVRLLVATPDGLAHARFTDLPRFLAAGDLVVVNTSATIAAAVDGRRGSNPVTVHFSTPIEDGTWLVELRADGPGHERVTDAEAGEEIGLPARASLTLLHRYPDPAADRLWVAAPAATRPEFDVGAFLAAHGRPIRYSYVPDQWPLADYQTVFATEPGSAEMPSAGRPFSPELVTSLIAKGVVFAPITLHAGVASLEAGESPLPERFVVPEPTAQLVNLTRAAGRRVIAVGTTVTRALETAAASGTEAGTVGARRGWTDLVLGAEHPAHVVSGLITGWHDPEASHLALLEAVAGPELVRAAYHEADEKGYLGHEFGDSCLLLPPM
jgi:S-adenosylmethionine:tRNA ribosyltransferase-isomerase